MDAVEFIKERDRMCKSFGDDCRGCPGFDADEDVQCCMVGLQSTMDATAQIGVVEKWASAHSRKTRQDVFLEQYPEAKVADDGILMLCPVVVSSTYRNQYGGCKTPHASCDDCCRKFWGKEGA